MNDQARGLEAFLKGWVPEFGRSVQTFEGEKPAIAWEVTSLEPVEQTAAATEGFFWWQQPFETDRPYSLWVGTPAETLSELTSKLAKTSGDRKQSFIDLLNQSFEGAAHALNWGRSTPIVCGEGAGQDDPPPTPLRIATLKIDLRGQHLVPILVGAELSFDAMLEPGSESNESSDTALAPGADRADDAEASEFAPFLDRLIGLDLPVSIVLGRTVIALRDVLKFTAGSLIELDRHVGDPAEIVVSNAVVARGEVVSVRGNYGIRVQEVISRNDRLALQTSVRKTSAQSSAQ